MDIRENIIIILCSKVSNKCALKADFHEVNKSLKLNISTFLRSENFAANSPRGPEMKIENFINCPGLGNLGVGMSVIVFKASHCCIYVYLALCSVFYIDS